MMQILGRFTSPDSLAEGRPAESEYIYVGNNPTNSVDPDGNWWFLVTGAVSAVVDYGAQVATNCYNYYAGNESFMGRCQHDECRSVVWYRNGRR